jgi:hypothetical protein
VAFSPDQTLIAVADEYNNRIRLGLWLLAL